MQYLNAENFIFLQRDRLLCTDIPFFLVGISFGKSVVKAMEDAGIDIAFKAPTPEAPSVGRALELYLSNSR